MDKNIYGGTKKNNIPQRAGGFPFIQQRADKRCEKLETNLRMEHKPSISATEKVINIFKNRCKDEKEHDPTKLRNLKKKIK